MSKFFSNFEKQIDAKGRISVPAPFRAAVSELGGDRIYCFPSFVDQAIECYPPPAYMALLERIEGIVESPEAREQLELAVITRGVELSFDGEGRVSFPERVLKLVGIEKAVTFAGRGDRCSTTGCARRATTNGTNPGPPCKAGAARLYCDITGIKTRWSLAPG